MKYLKKYCIVAFIDIFMSFVFGSILYLIVYVLQIDNNIRSNLNYLEVVFIVYGFTFLSDAARTIYEIKKEIEF